MDISKICCLLIIVLLATFAAAQDEEEPDMGTADRLEMDGGGVRK